MPSLFVSQSVSSAVNLILGIEIQNMNGCVGHNKLSIGQYTLIEQSVGHDLPTDNWWTKL